MHWLDIVKSQIKEQERRGLMLWKNDIEWMMRLRHGAGVSDLLERINQKQTQLSKRHDIESKLRQKLKAIAEVSINSHLCAWHSLGTFVDMCYFVPCFHAFFDLLLSLGQRRGNS